MKEYILILVLICSITTSVDPLFAIHSEKESERPMKEGGKADKADFSKLEIEILLKLLKAKPEKLRIMRKTIERVELMTPEQKRGMSLRLNRFRNASDSEKEQFFSRFQSRMNTLKHYWDSLEPDKKKAETKKFYNLKEQERSDYIKQLRERKK